MYHQIKNLNMKNNRNYNKYIHSKIVNNLFNFRLNGNIYYNKPTRQVFSYDNSLYIQPRRNFNITTNVVKNTTTNVVKNTTTNVVKNTTTNVVKNTTTNVVMNTTTNVVMNTTTNVDSKVRNNHAFIEQLYHLSDNTVCKYNKHRIQPNDRFIIFNYDIGGFNNIRISFEVIIILAKLLNRVLVIPPKTNMYLLDKNTDIFDYYSINNLSQYIKICNYEDLSSNIKTVNDLFFIAKKSKDYYFFINDNKNNKGIQCVNNKIFIEENNRLLDLNSITQKYLCLYTHVNTDDVNLILDNYTGNTVNLRFLNNYDYFFNMNPSSKNKLYKFIFESIKINKKLVNYSVELYKKLNLNNYNAVHLRSNDFQYENNLQKINIKNIASTIKQNFDVSKKLFIITDHNNIQEITECFSEYNITTCKDIYKHATIENKYKGIIESLLCVLADNFIGTYLSTFSFYIQILRGYMKRYNNYINDDLMYTTVINPKIDYVEFKKYQESNSNDTSENCVWSRITKNVWKF